jgi:hypothetical protein
MWTQAVKSALDGWMTCNLSFIPLRIFIRKLPFGKVCFACMPLLRLAPSHSGRLQRERCSSCMHSRGCARACQALARAELALEALVAAVRPAALRALRGCLLW